jgi:RimJ/RimL family protein N-acetyltransferase
MHRRPGETVIETERLKLRNWKVEDVEPFIRHLNNPAVMRWLGGVREPEDQDWVVRERFMAWQEDRGYTFWVVERKEDGELLGFCGLKIADDDGSPVEGALEIGWRLREDAWGKRYAKEAAEASLDFAFNRLGAKRVVALTVQDNKASWGLMVRLGMTRRPGLDYAGPTWADGIVIVYELEREQWRA